MWDRLALVTAPAGLPLSIEDMKAQSRVDNGEEDYILTDYIARATSMIDGPRGIGHCLMLQTWRLALDGFLDEIIVPLGPVQSVTSIKYLDSSGAEQPLAADQYWANLDRDPLRIVPGYGASWPGHRVMPGSVKVEFTAGYPTAGDIPAQLRAAVAMLAAHMYENRESTVVGTHLQPFEIPSVNQCLENFRAGTVA